MKKIMLTDDEIELLAASAEYLIPSLDNTATLGSNTIEMRLQAARWIDELTMIKSYLLSAKYDQEAS
jgi:hypothetical protein